MGGFKEIPYSSVEAILEQFCTKQEKVLFCRYCVIGPSLKMCRNFTAVCACLKCSNNGAKYAQIATGHAPESQTTYRFLVPAVQHTELQCATHLQHKHLFSIDFLMVWLICSELQPFLMQSRQLDWESGDITAQETTIKPLWVKNINKFLDLLV